MFCAFTKYLATWVDRRRPDVPGFVASTLLKHYDMTSETEFFNAIRQGDATRVKNILQPQPELLGSRDERGSTPLVLASYLGQLEVTQALVEAGADPNARDAAGNTALMGVSFKGDVATASYLLDRGADAGAINSGKATALTFAAMFNRPELVDLLLKAGADPTVADEQGLTPADHARQRGLSELADRLSAGI